MSAKSFLLPLAFSALLTFFVLPTCRGTVITFDDLSETGVGDFVPLGYQGLVWSNFVSFNAILATNRPEVGVSGYYYGMVSASNVLYNSFSDPAEIDSPGTN